MNSLKEILLGEIEDFRKVGHKFLDGELNLMQFKHESGGMGMYAHRGGKEFMIRFRIPSGVTDSDELNLIYDYAKKHSLGGIHFTVTWVNIRWCL